MKKLVVTFILFFVVVCTYSQKDVTQFLGIPIDGSKHAMTQKLKAKGFQPLSYDKDVLEGTFNGVSVNLYIVTNKEKVCRIMVADVNKVDERSIQIRFNNLCQQFENNPKYFSLGYELIPDNEDISYEMNVNNKRYEAAFYQRPTDLSTHLSDSTLIAEKIMPKMLKKYTAEELANPTDDIRQDMLTMGYEYLIEFCTKKSVWFIISKLYGKYYISMYYDNEYNQANGEEL